MVQSSLVPLRAEDSLDREGSSYNGTLYFLWCGLPRAWESLSAMNMHATVASWCPSCHLLSVLITPNSHNPSLGKVHLYLVVQDLSSLMPQEEDKARHSKIVSQTL